MSSLYGLGISFAPPSIEGFHPVYEEARLTSRLLEEHPVLFDIPSSLFKDTVLSAPELVRVLRDPQVRQSLPLNILNKADNLFNKFADAPPETFKYAMNTRDLDLDYYDPDFAERVIPIIDAKKYKRWKNSMDPLYQSAMREHQLMREGWGSPPDNFAKGGLVERNVYNHQKYL